MHELYFTRRDTVGLLTRHFEVARIDLDGGRTLTALSGARVSEAELAKSLGIQRAPTMVFYDRDGKEILRHEKYLTPENFTAGLLTFLGTHAYRKYDSLQDWLRVVSAESSVRR
jgi:thioredoxin-related protein